jgi:predicted peptidase
MRHQILRLCAATAAALTVGILAAGTALAQSQPSQVRVFQPGIHLDNFPLSNGLTIRYAISIPKNYSPTNPVPLVLALHYGGAPNGAAQGVMLTLVHPALADLGAIIVAPESLGGAWSTAQNDRSVNALLDAVEAAYRVDTKKVAVTGFSMGGTGVWFFAGKYPERFTAAIPIAGMPPASAGNWKMPVFAVHSRNDEVMPIGPTETRIGELRKAGVQAELVALTGISHHETPRFTDGLRRAVPWLKGVWK